MVLHSATWCTNSRWLLPKGCSLNRLLVTEGTAKPFVIILLWIGGKSLEESTLRHPRSWQCPWRKQCWSLLALMEPSISLNHPLIWSMFWNARSSVYMDLRAKSLYFAMEGLHSWAREGHLDRQLNPTGAAVYFPPALWVKSKEQNYIQADSDLETKKRGGCCGKELN